MNIALIRKTITESKEAMARLKAEHSMLLKNLMQERQDLRDLLSCEQGEEKEALGRLKERVKELTAQLDSFKAEIEEALDELE